MESRKEPQFFCAEADIVQNLKDAGCKEAIIQAFIQDVRDGDYLKGTEVLQMHRRSLLNDLHEDQKRIDCLDYFLYKMQKELEVMGRL